MKKWSQPEITNLVLAKTAGNPSTRGNDSAIPDCIENAFETLFGDHSGDAPSPSPTHSN